MKPENRNSETVRRHLMASLHIGIPRKRLEAYFARIASIYAIYESELGHGVPFGKFRKKVHCVTNNSHFRMQPMFGYSEPTEVGYGFWNIQISAQLALPS